MKPWGFKGCAFEPQGCKGFKGVRGFREGNIFKPLTPFAPPGVQRVTLRPLEGGREREREREIEREKERKRERERHKVITVSTRASLTRSLTAAQRGSRAMLQAVVRNREIQEQPRAAQQQVRSCPNQPRTSPPGTNSLWGG